MIEQYLAVESQASAQQVISREDPRITTALKHKIFQGSEAIALYDLTTIRVMNSTPESRLQAKFLGELLNIRLRRKFREERGDVYSIYVQQNQSMYPQEATIFTITFTCDPQKYDELSGLLYNEIEAFYQDVDPQQDLDNIKLQFQTGYEIGLKENKQWMKSLRSFIRRKQHPDVLFNFPERLKAINQDDLQSYAQTMLNLERSLEACMFPKT